MRSYRFRFVAGGRAMFVADHEFADDLDALDDAEFLANDFDVEIWQGARMVARVAGKREVPAYGFVQTYP